MGKDKIYHFAVGMAIAILTYVVTQNVTLAIGASVLAGIGKEVFDKVSGKGTCEVLDALATILGGAIATGTIYLIGRIL